MSPLPWRVPIVQLSASEHADLIPQTAMSKTGRGADGLARTHSRSMGPWEQGRGRRGYRTHLKSRAAQLKRYFSDKPYVKHWSI